MDVLVGKSSKNGGFSTAMFVYQRVHKTLFLMGQLKDKVDENSACKQITGWENNFPLKNDFRFCLSQKHLNQRPGSLQITGTQNVVGYYAMKYLIGICATHGNINHWNSASTNKKQTKQHGTKPRMIFPKSQITTMHWSIEPAYGGFQK